jgi:hypothetical protein
MRKLRMATQDNRPYCMSYCVAALLGLDVETVVTALQKRYFEIGETDLDKANQLVIDYMSQFVRVYNVTSLKRITDDGFYLVSVPSLNSPNSRHAIVIESKYVYIGDTKYRYAIVYDPNRESYGRFYYGSELDAEADYHRCRPVDWNRAKYIAHIPSLEFEKGPVFPDY